MRPWAGPPHAVIFCAGPAGTRPGPAPAPDAPESAPPPALAPATSATAAETGEGMAFAQRLRPGQARRPRAEGRAVAHQFGRPRRCSPGSGADGGDR